MQGTFLGYIVSVLLAALSGYLIGSLNGGIVSVRLLKGKDIRDYGSGNAGLTNVLRCFGKGCGILTLVIDLGKGAAAMLLAEFIGKGLGWAPLWESTNSANDFRWLCYVAAIFVVAGHVFPVWHDFRGGKGVLVGVSVFLVINPLSFVILLAIFAAVLLRSKYVSLASCVATAAVIPATFFLEYYQRDTRLFSAIFYTVMITFPALLIIYSHHENIERLKNGTERKIGEKKHKAEHAAEADDAPAETATRDCWETQPMPEQQAAFSPDIHLSEEELERLKRGRIPRRAEDPWFLFFEDGQFFCHRSRTGFCIYIADVSEEGDITHAVVNRDPEQYPVTDEIEDLLTLKYLIFSCAGRHSAAKAAREHAAKRRKQNQ